MNSPRIKHQTPNVHKETPITHQETSSMTSVVVNQDNTLTIKWNDEFCDKLDEVMEEEFEECMGEDAFYNIYGRKVGSKIKVDKEKAISIVIEVARKLNPAVPQHVAMSQDDYHHHVSLFRMNY